MKFLLATKQKMTQYFDENGRSIGATVLKAGPITVTQVRNTDRDGYSALQFGYGEQKEQRLTKAKKGHLKKLGNFHHLREYRLEDGASADLKEGDTIDASVFGKGDTVEVSGISKGKGFQGGVKRHGFAGGSRSHGQKHSEREVGSIGATGPQRVFKGTRMGGRMGTDRVTVKNLKILEVDTANNIILVSGAIPGRMGTLIELKG